MLNVNLSSQVDETTKWCEGRMVYNLKVFMPSLMGSPPIGSLISTGDGHMDMVPEPVLPHKIGRL
jgi:hypothetical protein